MSPALSDIDWGAQVDLALKKEGVGSSLDLTLAAVLRYNLN